MEEGPPAPAPAPRPPLPPHPASHDNAFSSAVVHAYPPPLTYIVQVPKDQIYRVPPKENARLVEEYRAHFASLRKRRTPCLNFFLRFLCVFISIAIPLLAASLVFYIVVRPTAPVFDVDCVEMESKALFEIFMEVKNPSIGMGYSIEKSVGRGVRLSYKGKVLMDGESPELDLKAKESKRFKLGLHGEKKAVLEEVEESLQGSKKAVELKLMVGMPVRAQIWRLRLWRMKMKVECDVRLKGMGKVMKVLSQDCMVVVGLAGS
ncbi:NDR1/HIN1-like protein 13 [Phalaenopsis equestris]|uniref:NDR1/HIN1-like protein 13 n=1 Tax=Phalaenopsis equestris TaxID=78828 RepID=UPI0009E24F88|nr:NDR1/HIN1-like protein 13 [Phalaenopsis equestris]